MDLLPIFTRCAELRLLVAVAQSRFVIHPISFAERVYHIYLPQQVNPPPPLPLDQMFIVQWRINYIRSPSDKVHWTGIPVHTCWTEVPLGLIFLAFYAKKKVELAIIQSTSIFGRQRLFWESNSRVAPWRWFNLCWRTLRVGRRCLWVVTGENILGWASEQASIVQEKGWWILQTAPCPGGPVGRIRPPGPRRLQQGPAEAASVQSRTSFTALDTGTY